MNEDYISNTTIEELAARIGAAHSALVTTHAKPDGDAFGSTLGLARAMDRRGIATEVWYIPPVPPAFQELAKPTPVQMAGDDHQPGDDFDLIIVTDTGAWSQMREMELWLSRRTERICIIDHHIQGDVDMSDCRLIDTDAAAASEMIADLIDQLGVEITQDIAVPLYLGIASDTGWFRFSNVRARTFRLAARLLEAGVDHPTLYRLSEQSDDPSRLQLLARALSSMQLLNHGRSVLMTLTRKDYAQCGASPGGTHGFADMPQSIGSVQVVCFLGETDDQTVKMSIRSKHGPNAIDVNRIARQFGGGGHARAAGAKIKGTLDEVRTRVIQVLEKL